MKAKSQKLKANAFFSYKLKANTGFGKHNKQKLKAKVKSLYKTHLFKEQMSVFAFSFKLLALGS
ncbi:MAG: hypothetical protein IJU61_05690 [Victivallales bacterium]|nr:hypothetical protein [Victivallales bacterium]